MDKEVENLEDHGCPDLEDLAETDKEKRICWSNPFRQKTQLHCEKGNADFFSICSISSVNFCIMEYFVSIYEVKSYILIQSYLR